MKMMAQGENKIYDLEERTAVFGENVIKMCNDIYPNTVSRPIISQLVRSATSIGANYVEATGACSKKDFANKIFICKKEAQETKHWLRMLLSTKPELGLNIEILKAECMEIILIFGKIASKSRE